MSHIALASAPQRVAAARALYAEGRAVSEIRAATGLTGRRLYHWLDYELLPDGTERLAPLVRRKPGIKTGAAPDAKRRLALANRIWRAAAVQVREIELRLASAGAAPAEAERDARALAVLARVVRELAALDAASRKAEKDDETRARDEEAAGPADPDTVRRELARRLDALRGEQPD